MRIVAIADTHGMHDEVRLPDGDMLIVAGDICGHSQMREVGEFNRFLGNLDYKHKILVAGNHDWPFERFNAAARDMVTNAIYLQDEAVEIEGIKIYGSPWQPEFLNWAFNLPRGLPLKHKWDMIPEDTEILVTHGPPYERLDRVSIEPLGSEELKKAVERIKPKYHVFGHIHAGYGSVRGEHTVFINASVCTEAYEPINEPIVFDM
jgi:Icc-related predicted phosphoesterase